MKGEAWNEKGEVRVREFGRKLKKYKKKQTQRREIEQNQKIGIKVKCKEVNGQI